jgi:hypothetical protein
MLLCPISPSEKEIIKSQNAFFLAHKTAPILSLKSSLGFFADLIFQMQHAWNKQLNKFH